VATGWAASASSFLAAAIGCHRCFEVDLGREPGPRCRNRARESLGDALEILRTRAVGRAGEAGGSPPRCTQGIARRACSPASTSGPSSWWTGLSSDASSSRFDVSREEGVQNLFDRAQVGTHFRDNWFMSSRSCALRDIASSKGAPAERAGACRACNLPSANAEVAPAAQTHRRDARNRQAHFRAAGAP